MIKTYLDEYGYYRFNDSDDLVHRWVALKYIYRPNRDDYSKPFGKYIVHHIDRNKRNNNPSNLEILRMKEHRKEHGKRIGFMRKIIEIIQGY